MLYKVVAIFESVDKILKCDQMKASMHAVLCCGTVNNDVQGSFIYTFKVNG